jgi:nucleotide-binding universal stress UspA family protein
MTNREPYVLVGVGSTPASAAAVRAAAEIAESFALPLHLVRVWRDVDWFLSAPADAVPELVAEEHEDRRLLAAAAAAARSVAPDIPVRTEFVPGSVYAVLLDRTPRAHVLVLGCEYGTEPGHIAQWYLEHARCPVLVVGAGGQVAADTLRTPVLWALAPAVDRAAAREPSPAGL